MRLAHVVPHLPPEIDGVGGYAAALARGLAGSGVTSRFLVAAPGWAGDGRGAGTPIGERSAPHLLRLLAAGGADALLVHYANYGYQRRGCPCWLVEAACRWRAARPSRRLVTFFHEVYASGPPWRSSFWLSPVQRRLAARLLRASDGAATSLGLYGRMLARWGPRQQVRVMPVFSAVGEPEATPALAARPRRLLVFGGPGNRRRAYGERRGSLALACAALAIEEIVDLGPPIELLPARVEGVPVRALGTRSEEEVGQVLLGSYAGFLSYPPSFLAKSTVFAAYCAHGMLPVCAWPPLSPRRRPPPPPRPAEDERPPFWEPGAEAAPADPAALAARARAWYGGHDLKRQAALFRGLLGAAPPPERRSETA